MEGGACLAGAIAAGCATQTPRPSPPAIVAGPVVQDLHSLADLATVFDQDRDHPRIVLLLSPT